MENDKSLHIITDAKRIQSKNKRLSIIGYFKNKIDKNGILFLQETRSTTSDKGKWKHIQVLALKENGKTNSLDLFFIDMVLLTLVVY